VIVVDDGSTDDTPRLLDNVSPDSYSLRVVRQANAGLNTARNTGAAMAEAELLAYLDDDVIVPSAYVEAMLNAFDGHPDAAAVAGQITLRCEAEPPAWMSKGLTEYLSAFDAASRPEFLVPPDYPRGANFGLRHRAWSDTGGFRPNFDRRGASLVSNGELEFFRRLYQHGGRVVACPAAEVFHRVPAERLTLGWFQRRARAQGESDALLEPARSSARKAGLVLRELWRSGRAAPILARGLLGHSGTAATTIWLSYCRGRLSGVIALAPERPVRRSPAG
jgi:GT2 family glycosyltransferase